MDDAMVGCVVSFYLLMNLSDLCEWLLWCTYWRGVALSEKIPRKAKGHLTKCCLSFAKSFWMWNFHAFERIFSRSTSLRPSRKIHWELRHLQFAQIKSTQVSLPYSFIILQKPAVSTTTIWTIPCLSILESTDLGVSDGKLVLWAERTGNLSFRASYLAALSTKSGHASGCQKSQH